MFYIDVNNRFIETSELYALIDDLFGQSTFGKHVWFDLNIREMDSCIPRHSMTREKALYGLVSLRNVMWQN
jgi:hypothetical protein